MSEAQLRSAILLYLASCNSLSLATSAAHNVHAASVFFVSDENFSCYFLSSADSLHIQQTRANPRVAATINQDYSDWFEIKGVQLTGHVDLVTRVERAGVMERYLKKFTAVNALVDHPGNAQEALIGERLLASDCYRIVPDWIRLIDNQQGFGVKQELVL